MPEPKILFNSSTGSDTAASGAGPTTALTGTGASLSSTTAVDLSADSPNLAGVATDGSACLWVSTSSGRQFAKITAVNNSTKVVTVALAYGVTETGRTWAIGGKRATLDATSSRTLFGATTGTVHSTGWQAGWEAVLETDQTITSTLIFSGPNSAGFVNLRSNVDGTTRTITCSANTSAINWVISGWPAMCEFRDIKIQNSNATKTSANAVILSGSGSNRNMLFRRCVLGDPTNTLQQAINPNGVIASCNFIDCCIQNCAGIAIDSTGSVTMYGCLVRNNTGTVGLRVNGAPVSVHNSVFHNNSGDHTQFNFTNFSGLAIIADSTFDAAGSDSLSNEVGSGGLSGYHAINCNFTTGGGFGVRGALVSELPNCSAINCNFGSGSDANTSGAISGTLYERDNIAAASSYVNKAGADYSPGANIQAKGFPLSPATLGAGQSVATSSIDIGANQSAGGGGGGLILLRPMNGGYSA